MNSMKHDAFDRILAAEARETMPEIETMIRQGKNKLKTMESLADDMFYSFYPSNPELIDKEKLSGLGKFNHAEMSKIMESTDYQNLRQYTRLDDFGSALALKTTLQSFTQRLKDDKELQKVIDETEGGDESSLERNQSVLRRAVAGAVQQATEELEQADSTMSGLFGSGWGCGEGQEQKAPLEQRMKMYEETKKIKKLQDIAKLFGRLKAIAAGSRKTKLSDEHTEIHSVTFGDDLPHVLPHELALLRHPALKMDFMRRMTEKKLLCYELNATVPTGKGAIIELIDDSGSMYTYHKGHTLSDWARALGMGLLDIARRENRGFAAQIFSYKEGKSWEFPGGKASPEQVIKFATYSIGGGTEYETPLRYAVEQLEKNPDLKKADVVLITDGVCRLDQSFEAWLLEKKRTLDFSIHVVLLGGAFGDHLTFADTIHTGIDEEVSKELYKGLN